MTHCRYCGYWTDEREMVYTHKIKNAHEWSGDARAVEIINKLRKELKVSSYGICKWCLESVEIIDGESRFEPVGRHGRVKDVTAGGQNCPICESDNTRLESGNWVCLECEFVWKG